MTVLLYKSKNGGDEDWSQIQNGTARDPTKTVTYRDGIGLPPRSHLPL